MLGRSDVAPLQKAAAELSSSVDSESAPERMPSAVADLFREMHKRQLRLESMLAAVSRGVIRISSDREILEITEPASRNLLKYFPTWEVACGALPKDIETWLDANGANGLDSTERSAKPLVAMRDGSTLRVVLVSDPGGEITLLMEERGRLANQTRSSTGLTSRECEILKYIESGKSDAAVATLCGISKRTVQKHVENIFKKLNVETRTAAVRSVLDSIDDEFA